MIRQTAVVTLLSAGALVLACSSAPTSNSADGGTGGPVGTDAGSEAAAASDASNGGPAADGGGAPRDAASPGACAAANVTLPPWAKVNSNGAGRISVVTDVSGDGKLDIVDDGPCVTLGKGDGTFQPFKCFTDGLHEGLYSIDVGDLTKDGKPDILGISNQGKVYVFPNQGSGDFTNLAGPQQFDTGLDVIIPAGLLAVDLNKDGAADAVFTSESATSIWIMLNDGTGKFPTPPTATPLSQDASRRGLVTADFNKDGNPDVAVTTGSTGTDSGLLAVFFGDGKGTLTKSAEYPVGHDDVRTGTIALTVADLDGDGAPDLAVSNDGTNQVIAFKNDGTGKFTGGNAPLTLPTDDGGANPATMANGITSGDVNGDGKGDLALIDTDHDYAVTIFYGNGDGTFQLGVNYPNAAFPVGVTSPIDIRAGDFNGDGLSDIQMTGLSPDDGVVPGVGSASWIAITSCTR